MIVTPRRLSRRVDMQLLWTRHSDKGDRLKISSLPIQTIQVIRVNHQLLTCHRVMHCQFQMLKMASFCVHQVHYSLIKLQVTTMQSCLHLQVILDAGFLPPSDVAHILLPSFPRFMHMMTYLWFQIRQNLIDRDTGQKP